MADRSRLHDLRQQAHDKGIQGNSKMTEGQLRQAMKKVDKGASPQAAKREARG
ncbi:hypothetical protein ACIBXA_15045 [Micromonospora echinaurantiaca]|uniref:Rho termination factor, N-terminal domain n=1 Tax=Micromonospora echinaurantiaca TaxID=47857 RepID=A0A1C5KCQ1_9ACTN|nr:MULTISPECIES: hypothetical protein [Micromonospora]SCG80457.1 hypothetical protein GA0070609_6451 [Micromonospora echinaurantiaca]